MERDIPFINFTNSNFINKSRLFTYVFVAFMVGLVQILEDLVDDDTSLLNMLREFALIVVVLITVLPLLGFFIQKSWRWWQKKKILATWKYNYLLFFNLCLFAFPLLLMVIASKTFFVDDQGDLWVVWVSSLVFVLIVIALEVFWYMLEKRQQLETQNERLLRNQEMTKYQALMNQLNPHFLFNSLNVLSFLVYKDQRSAEQFIEELSKIYRYILQLNDTYIVPLKKEIEFIESYMYLQKIRHRDNLTYETQISIESLQKYIPPLTLEVLVENAIKHNVIDAEYPLHIKIHAQNGQLIVENNVRPRNESDIQSNHVGLSNLAEKFQILESPLPEFSIKNKSFIAKIPLLVEG